MSENPTGHIDCKVVEEHSSEPDDNPEDWNADGNSGSDRLDEATVRM